jgi:hypothetical protein
MQIYIDGTGGSIFGGNYIGQTGIPNTFSLSVGAGYHTVQLYWYGGDANIWINSSEMVVLGVKR